MSQGNPISRTGLLLSPRKHRKLNTKLRKNSKRDLNLLQCTKPIQYSLRPFASLFNPYSRNCSILCNHPGPNEIKDVVKQVKERDCKGHLSPILDHCCGDVSCELINITAAQTTDDTRKLSDDYFHYADSDSRPLTPTPTPTIISNRTRVSQTSYLFHRRRCHTPDPVNTCANERKQLVLDLRRSHSQETIVYCNASEISIQADSVNLTAKSVMKIDQQSQQPKNMRLCEQEARKKSAERNALQMQKDEPPVPNNVVCINDRTNIEDEVEGFRRRGKKKKKHKDGNTFRIDKEPETQITTLGPDSPNASARPSIPIKDTIVKGSTQDSTTERTRNCKYLRSNFITEDALKILRRGLDIDIVESAFEKFMNTALKEAFQTIPMDQFNNSNAALHEFNENKFGVENSVNNDKWLIMPRQFMRSATRFSLPINTQKLTTLTAFEYLSQYVWISDHRKNLYRFVFNKYICKMNDQQDMDDNENEDENELERATPSQTTNEKSIQPNVYRECVMSFNDLIDAFTNVLGYCGPVEQMLEKIQQIIKLTEINDKDHSTINFRSWCGLVAFAERFLNNLSFEEDPCDEVEIADFETVERKFKNLTPSTALRRILMIIKYIKKE
ncbi:uncharacterized protein LOC116350915 [Contarinia nasturtii]|uniref:uncharacterized protein LOC116350915 n=1 Tax=Contarinia nasturtii TaxID=265458 RepID=UPI0012D3B4C6|nr:uncharacterized protein LOC116350915 [Contarinia nasturtii]